MATEAHLKEHRIAVFFDFENIITGVRDAKYDQFHLELILDRLVEKGKIIFKRAYCDWSRFREHKNEMHEHSFELVDIPKKRISGKNSADIRMVVDALDLCYTKAHVDTFVIVSGDSDFSPLVSKLRENDKTVIGIGVKKSTSDLLVSACDEFIYYDDLVREQKPRRRKTQATPAPATTTSPKRKSPANAPSYAESAEAPPADNKLDEALDLIRVTVEALVEERGGDEPVWGSMVKQTLKRRKPGFNERYYGFGSFNELLEEAGARGQVELERDAKSGGYIVRPAAP